MGDADNDPSYGKGIPYYFMFYKNKQPSLEVTYFPHRSHIVGMREYTMYNILYCTVSNTMLVRFFA